MSGVTNLEGFKVASFPPGGLLKSETRMALLRTPDLMQEEPVSLGDRFQVVLWMLKTADDGECYFICESYT